MATEKGIVLASGLTQIGDPTKIVAQVDSASGTFDVVINATKVASITTSGMTNARTAMFPAGAGKAGATAGWAFPSAHSGFTNSGVVGLPASQSASTWVIPVQGLRVGDNIVSFTVRAQIESAGGAVTLDADLRKLTIAAADITDASIGAITQVAVSADTAVSSSKTLATAEVVAADEQYYILVTGTTAGSTDIQLLGATVTTSVV
jgi:hypothetical protein